MRARILYTSRGEEYELDGKRVTKEEFDAQTSSRLEEVLAAGRAPRGHSAGCWPLYSDALAVHPHQIEQARSRNRRHGVLVDYLPDGRAILADRGARRDLMKLEGCHDNEGGYGDDTGASSGSSLPSREELLGGPVPFIGEEGVGYVGETASRTVPDPVIP